MYDPENPYKWWPTNLRDKKPEDMSPEFLRFARAMNRLIENHLAKQKQAG